LANATVDPTLSFSKPGFELERQREKGQNAGPSGHPQESHIGIQNSTIALTIHS
jgi:hypothetical protein